MSGHPESEYDVAIVGELRFPGGTSTCIAQEIKAQARAGYRTALVPVWSNVQGLLKHFHPEIAQCLNSGLAMLVPPSATITARHLSLHHPNSFETLEAIPKIAAVSKLLIAHQLPSDNSQPYPFYDVGKVLRNFATVFGDGVRWAPVGPEARQGFTDHFPQVPLAEEDWLNVIDVDDWAVQRHPGMGIPVIGRHGRPHPQKWPNLAQDLIDAYPDSPNVKVKILGGAEVPRQILRRIPDNWTVWDYNAIHPKHFLSSIDFFVYFHHPLWTEAFGRTILEAMASGAVAIVPEHFRRLFGDGCLYAQPKDVMGLVQTYFQDPEAYGLQSARGQSFVRQHFGYDLHIRRLGALIGSPSAKPISTNLSPARAKRRVIFMTSNGEGMGHFTRMLALAKRASDDVQPILVTMSPGMHIAKDAGFPVEYIPRLRDDWSWEQLEPFLTKRLAAIVDHYQAKTIIFDGTAPYAGVTMIKQVRDVHLIWMRRALWKAGEGKDLLKHSAAFDLVIEPGEIAGGLDRGLTVALRDQVACVDPIVMCDESELLARADARRALGLNQEGLAVFLLLGSDNANNVGIPARTAAQRLLDRGVQVVMADWLISRNHADLPAGVKRVRHFPNSIYFKAFDFAIAAPGYNTFHELMAFHLPTIFIPMHKNTEDQGLRSHFVAEEGAAINVAPYSDQALERALDAMLDETLRLQIIERCKALWPGNGAKAAVSLVERLMQGESPRSLWGREGAKLEAKGEDGSLEFEHSQRGVGNVNPLFDIRQPKRLTPPRGHLCQSAMAAHMSGGESRILYLLLDHSEETFQSCLDDIVAQQMQSGGFRPIIVTDTDFLGDAYKLGFVCEYIPAVKVHTQYFSRDSWEELVEQRVRNIVETYEPDQVICLDGSASGPGAKASRRILPYIHGVMRTSPGFTRPRTAAAPRIQELKIAPPRGPFSSDMVRYLRDRVRTVGLRETLRRPLQKALRYAGQYLS